MHFKVLFSIFPVLSRTLGSVTIEVLYDFMDPMTPQHFKCSFVILNTVFDESQRICGEGW